MPVTVNVINETDVPEYVHFHGLLIPGDVDGWILSTGIYNTTGGTITSLQAPNPAPAFRVNGPTSPVPEPSTSGLLSAAVIALTLLGGRRTRGNILRRRTGDSFYS